MERKTVTTRKEHQCAACGETIPVGGQAIYYESRQPRFDKSDSQVGIEYIHEWVHTHDCVEFTPCEDHKWVDEMKLDGYSGFWKVGVPTGNKVCSKCGIRRSDV